MYLSVTVFVRTAPNGVRLPSSTGFFTTWALLVSLNVSGTRFLDYISFPCLIYSTGNCNTTLFCYSPLSSCIYRLSSLVLFRFVCSLNRWTVAALFKLAGKTLNHRPFKNNKKKHCTTRLVVQQSSLKLFLQILPQTNKNTNALIQLKENLKKKHTQLNICALSKQHKLNKHAL